MFYIGSPILYMKRFVQFKSKGYEYSLLSNGVSLCRKIEIMYRTILNIYFMAFLLLEIV